jgi:hypothetical protein
MSALIPLAKALHAIASGLQRQGERAGEDGDDATDRLLTHLSHAVTWAADDLGRQAKAEASGPAFEDRLQPAKARHG